VCYGSRSPARVSHGARSFVSRNEERPHAAQIAFEESQRRLPDGNHVLHVARAGDDRGAIGEIDVGDIEPKQLRGADVRRVEQFDERTIPDAFRAGRIDRCREFLHLGMREHARRQKLRNTHVNERGGECCRLDAAHRESMQDAAHAFDLAVHARGFRVGNGLSAA